MKDGQEPAELFKLKQEEKLMEMQLSLKRMARRRVELNFELEKLSENEAATLKVISEIQATLASQENK